MLIYIHIGKCAGATFRNEFKRKFNIKIEKSKKKSFKRLNIKKNIVIPKYGIIDYANILELHRKKIQFNKNDKYIISIRNPIKRFISAFYWRLSIPIHEQAKFEQFIFNNSITINDFIINYLHKLKFNYFRHITEDINFHLGDFIKNCSRHNIIAVISQDTFKDDMKYHFDIDVKDLEHINHYKKNISEKAYIILKKYLHKDYECINELFKMECISDYQYKLLSK